jgi:hypothetical protein
METEDDEIKPVFDKNILASTHINFLFGAGVNGNVLPQLSQFKKTKEKIKSLNGNTDQGIESGIDNIEGSKQREEIKQVFIAEFNEFYKQAISEHSWETNQSLMNIEQLLRKTYSITHEAQNRNQSMKQVNIYSLNYDDIVERKLDQLGYFFNSISASNTATKATLMDVIGFDYTTKKYIPSFMISKLHGNIDKPIIPGREKYKEMLNADYFEIAFHMKGKLCRSNSILIVIGYSGNDSHINQILHDCLNTGLTMYWFKYSEDDIVPFDSIHGQVIVRNQDDYGQPVDSTEVCYKDMEKAWAEK